MLVDKGSTHKLLAVAVDIVCAVSPNDDDAGDGDDDYDDDGAV